MKIKGLFAVVFGVAITTLLLLFPSTLSQAQTSFHDLDNPAKQPFQMELSSQKITNAAPISLFSVPPGKRLVVEQVFLEVFADCSANDPESFFIVELQTRAGGRVANHDLTITRRAASAFSAQDYVASQLTRVYADPGSKVSLTVFAVSGLGRCLSHASLNRLVLSGHFVDVSQPKSPS